MSEIHAAGPENKYGGDVEKLDGLSKTVSSGNGQVIDSHGTKRDMKSRHAQMIAIGGSVGTGLFVASGQALAIGGPAFLLVAYCLTSMMVYGIMTGTVEIGTHTPMPGASMALFCSRYLSRSLGFALGYLYFYTFGVLVAYELTAATILIDFWPNNVHIAVWISVLMVVVIGLNLCPVKYYAETEFWFAGIKVVLIIGLLILSLVLMAGGGPNHEVLGFRYWNNPGAVKAYIVGGDGGRFTAFLYSWILAGFSFYFSPELIILTSGEMQNPRKNLPTAARQFFYRLTVFYVFGAIGMGVICSSNADGLVSGSGNANASPWVIAIRNAGIPALPSIVNACIFTSAWSSGNSYLYMASRSLYSLSTSGYAPKIFQKCNRWGTPIYAVLACSCFVPLAFMTVSNEAGVVFNWFISFTNTAGYTSWVVCCVMLIRFRKACDIQSVTPPYRSRFQPYASWVCMVLFSFLLLCNGFTVFFPGRFTVSGFFSAYAGIAIFLALWLGHKITRGRHEPWIHDPATVDLQTGSTEVY